MERPEEKKQEIKIITRALLVEDYVPCQKFMTIYLNKLGYQVDLAINSFKAIQNIQSKTYDLIIADINLQGCLSGKKVIHFIRESKLNVGTPLIAWSAYINKNNEEKYLSWGADTALIKACGIKGLEKAIHQCVLTPRYEREYHYKLKTIQKRYQQKGGKKEWIQKIEDLRHIPVYLLKETLPIMNEYERWINVTKEGKELNQ